MAPDSRKNQRERVGFMTHQDVIDALKEQVDGRYDVIHERIPYYNGVPHAIWEIDLVGYLRAEDQLDIFEDKPVRGYKRQAKG